MDILLSSAYLAPIQYYTKLLLCGNGTANIEGCDNYTKQTYRNRCVIADANGPLQLTIPIEKPQTGKCLMRDIRISEHGNWRHRHWNALEAAYRHTPFFLYYEDDFRPFYEHKANFLYDSNMRLTETICQLIGITPLLKPTTTYIATHTHDYRDSISPKEIGQSDPTFYPSEYYQVFKEKNGFLCNLSIIDLLFNMGPESIMVLKNSIVQPPTQKFVP